MTNTMGQPFRTELYSWIAAHEEELYGGDSVAQVGLLFSPRNRDLIDTISSETYEQETSNHFAAYRTTANMLYRAHIPFDVIIDTDTDVFDRYTVLIAPEIQLMHESTVKALQAFEGSIIAIGSTGIYNEWLAPRRSHALTGTAAAYFPEVTREILQYVDTGKLATDAPAWVQFRLSRSAGRYNLVIINTRRIPMTAMTVDLRVPEATVVAQARLYRLNGEEVPVVATPGTAPDILRIQVPAGIERVALVTVTFNEYMPPPF